MKKWYGQIYTSDLMLCDCVSDYHFFFQIIWLVEIIGFKTSENCISLDINYSYLIPKYNKRAFGEFIIFEIK